MIISVHREAATAIFINPTAKLLPDLTQSLPGQNHPQLQHLHYLSLLSPLPDEELLHICCRKRPLFLPVHYSYSGSKTGTSGGTYSGSKSKNSGSSKKSSYYDGYDDGYDDVYMDGDYDYDRYDRDPDYADGVDDALDEFDGDW